jgi:hypothetical protein
LIASVTSDAASVTAITEAAPAPVEGSTFTLTTGADSSFGTDGNDTFTATNLTYGNTDLIVDSSDSDDDTLTITSSSADITATATVAGIENVALNLDGALSTGDTTFQVAMDNVSATNVSMDVVSEDSIVTGAQLDNVKTGANVTLSDDFSTMTFDGVNNGSYTLNFASDMNLTVTGATVDDVTIRSEKDVTIAASSNDGDLDITGEVVDVTAATAAGAMKIVATDNVDIQSAAAATSLDITAAGTVTLDTASDKATSVTITTTGSETEEHDVIVENGALAGATSVTISSAGSIDRDQAGTTATFGAATSLDLSADDDSVITAGLATSVTLASLDATNGVTFTASLATVDSLTLAGENDLTVAIDATQLTTETVTNTNTGNSIIGLGLNANANFDLSKVATDVLIRLDDEADTGNNTLQLATNAQVAFDDATAQTVALDMDAKDTDAEGNVLNLSTSNSDGTAGDGTASVTAALVLNDWETINLNATDAKFSTTSTITSNEATSFVISGTKDVTLTTVAGLAAGSTVDATGLSGAFAMTLNNVANAAETVKGGSGVDTITVSAASASGGTFSVEGNAGADVVNMTAADSITFNGGSGIDTLGLDNGLDFSAKTITLTSVEQINVDGAVTVAASLLDGATSLIAATQVGGADTANDVLTIKMDDTTFDGSSIAYASSFTAAGTDKVVIDGSGIALGQVITGTSKVDEITTSTGGDQITAGNGADVITAGAGTDVIDVTDSDDAVDSIVFQAYSTNGVDVISGFVSAEDTITLDKGDTSMTTTGAAGVFVANSAALGTAGNTLDWSAVVNNARDDIIELTTTLDTDVTLSASSTGAQLFEALSSDAGQIASLTIDAASKAFDLITYQNGNAYVWNLTEADGAATVEADEVTLIAVINNIASGGLAANDFLMS